MEVLHRWDVWQFAAGGRGFGHERPGLCAGTVRCEARIRGKSESHLHLTVLRAVDNPRSITRNSRVTRADSLAAPETTELARPQENNVAGAELNLTLFKGAVQLTGGDLRSSVD